MGEVRYMISEAARKVDVESHVLRYWEDELGLSVGRNEMGHRYYTDEDIQLFCCIKELKEQGMSLKTLKELIPDLLRAKKKSTEKKKLEENVHFTAADEKLQQLEYMLRHALKEALIQDKSIIGELVGKELAKSNALLRDELLKNGESFGGRLTRGVSDQVVSEIGALMQAKEEREEERFRRIDALIRRQQAMHKEMASGSVRHGSGKIFQTIFQPAKGTTV